MPLCGNLRESEQGSSRTCLSSSGTMALSPSIGLKCRSNAASVTGYIRLIKSYAIERRVSQPKRHTALVWIAWLLFTEFATADIHLIRLTNDRDYADIVPDLGRPVVWPALQSWILFERRRFYVQRRALCLVRLPSINHLLICWSHTIYCPNGNRTMPAFRRQSLVWGNAG